MITKPDRDRHSAVDGRWVVGLIIVAFLAPLIWFFVGMPGMDHSSDRTMDGMSEMEVADTTGAAARLSRLAPAEFEERLSDPAVTVVNVHIPYDGELPTTDAFVAYDQIVGDSDVPSDTSTPILLYCKTGRMSMIAGQSLIEAGYVDVADLDGGMDGWEATGRALVRVPELTRS